MEIQHGQPGGIQPIEVGGRRFGALEIALAVVLLTLAILFGLVLMTHGGPGALFSKLAAFGIGGGESGGEVAGTVPGPPPMTSTNPTGDRGASIPAADSGDESSSPPSEETTPPEAPIAVIVVPPTSPPATPPATPPTKRKPIHPSDPPVVVPPQDPPAEPPVVSPVVPPVVPPATVVGLSWDYAEANNGHILLSIDGTGRAPFALLDGQGRVVASGGLGGFDVLPVVPVNNLYRVKDSTGTSSNLINVNGFWGSPARPVNNADDGTWRIGSTGIGVGPYSLRIDGVARSSAARPSYDRVDLAGGTHDGLLVDGHGARGQTFAIDAGIQHNAPDWRPAGAADGYITISVPGSGRAPYTLKHDGATLAEESTPSFRVLPTKESTEFTIVDRTVSYSAKLTVNGFWSAPISASDDNGDRTWDITSPGRGTAPYTLTIDGVPTASAPEPNFSYAAPPGTVDVEITDAIGARGRPAQVHGGIWDETPTWSYRGIDGTIDIGVPGTGRAPYTLRDAANRVVGTSDSGMFNITPAEQTNTYHVDDSSPSSSRTCQVDGFWNSPISATMDAVDFSWRVSGTGTGIPGYALLVDGATASGVSAAPALTELYDIPGGHRSICLADAKGCRSAALDILAADVLRIYPTLDTYINFNQGNASYNTNRLGGLLLAKNGRFFGVPSATYMRFDYDAARATLAARGLTPGDIEEAGMIFDLKSGGGSWGESLDFSRKTDVVLPRTYTSDAELDGFSYTGNSFAVPGSIPWPVVHRFPMSDFSGSVGTAMSSSDPFVYEVRITAPAELAVGCEIYSNESYLQHMRPHMYVLIRHR